MWVKLVARGLLIGLIVLYILRKPGPAFQTLNLAAHDGWYFITTVVPDAAGRLLDALIR